VENLEEVVSYGTDAYGAYSDHTRSTMVRIHERAILAICIRKRYQYVVIRTYSLIVKSVNSSMSS
jgi:hypothetical protein